MREAGWVMRCFQRSVETLLPPFPKVLIGLRSVMWYFVPSLREARQHHRCAGIPTKYEFL
jgi:hypothetical protein